MEKVDSNAYYILIASAFFMLAYPFIELGQNAIYPATTVLGWSCENKFSGSSFYRVCEVSVSNSDMYLCALLFFVAAFLIKKNVISISGLINKFKKID